jgi:hypothetical protein
MCLATKLFRQRFQALFWSEDSIALALHACSAREPKSSEKTANRKKGGLRGKVGRYISSAAWVQFLPGPPQPTPAMHVQAFCSNMIKKREVAGDITNGVNIQTGPRPQQASTNSVFLVFKSKLELSFFEASLFRVSLCNKALAIICMHLSVGL